MKMNKLTRNLILGAILFVPGVTMTSNANASGSVIIRTALTNAQDAVATAERESSTANIAIARELVNALPEGVDKEGLQIRLNALTNITDVILHSGTVSAAVDIYIKCENLLSLSLDTNSVTFEEFGGTEDLELENAVTLTVTSSLPYDVNAYLPTAISNAKGDKNIDISVFEIKADEGEYKNFNNIGSDEDDKINLLSKTTHRNNKITHNIDLKLVGGVAHDADIYKTTVKFEVSQK